MINDMIEADPANFDVIRAKVADDDTAFFENQEGRFERGELIGEGGYGLVYREHDTLLDIDFARKELAPSNFVDDEVVGRFLREARLLFRLAHPNIVSVYDVGRSGRSAFIRMELFKGQKLNEVGQLKPERARQYILRLTSGLSHAHSRGVIHRDLKPSNVLVSGLELRIIDFGLGAFIDADLDTRITRSDESVAGGSFCAPELKESSKIRDAKCDVYSAGALWFYMLTGRDPSGSDLAVRLANVGDVPRRSRTSFCSACHC
jgi:serine/threonine-protein kinase